jgi:arylsulfatase
VHGFDEFFGNLYHLNAEESPEATDYPKDPRFRKRFGPRGVLKCKATDVDDETVDEQFGKVGKQVIENTGPLDTKRMETVDEEFLSSAIDFIERKTKKKPLVLLLQQHAACLDPPLPGQGQDRLGRLSRRHGLGGYIGQLDKLDELASPRTPSWCSPPTTEPRCCRGPTAALPRSEVRRTPTGRAARESPACGAGQA